MKHLDFTKRRAILGSLRVAIIALTVLVCNSAFSQGGGSSLSHNGTTVTFAGGDGLSQATAFQISTTQQLRDLATYVGQGGATNYASGDHTYTYFFELTNDLDFSGQDNFTPIGNESNAFRGRFKGNGFVIKNMTISTTNSPAGLFGCVGFSDIDSEGAEGTVYRHRQFCAIEGIGMENPTISSEHGHTNYGVGAIVGEVNGDHGEYIRNCWVKGGTITSTLIEGGTLGISKFVGGIVGKGLNTNEGNVTHNSVTILEEDGQQNIQEALPTVYNCYIDGVTITAGGNMGGIAGDIHCFVYNCFVANSTFIVSSHIPVSSGYAGVGPISGLSNHSNRNNCYSTNNTFSQDGQPVTSGLNQPVGVTSCTESELISYLQNLEGSPYVIDENGNIHLAIELSHGTNPITIKVGAWNLIGSWGSLSDLNNNSAGCDMAVSEFDYSTNNWGRYLSIVDGDQVENGRGYFVWAFANRPLTEEQIADSVESGDPIEATTTKLNVAYNGDRALDFVLTNNSNSDTKFYLLSNPQNMSIAVNVEQVQGAGAYVYDPTAAEHWVLKNNAIMARNGFYISPLNNASNIHVDFEAGNVYFTYDNANIQSKAEQTTNREAINDLLNNKIEIIASANNLTTKVLAKQSELATNDFDSWDTYSMFSDDNEDLIEPYFVVEGKDIYYNIFNELPYIAPINFKAQKQSNVQLTTNNVPENISVSVIDLSNNSEFVLDDNSTFEFLADNGENNNRYAIKFAAKNTSLQESELNNISIYNSNNTLTISGDNLQKVEIINCLGQKVLEQKLNSSSEVIDLNLNSGAYFVKVSSANNQKTQKIIVK